MLQDISVTRVLALLRGSGGDVRAGDNSEDLLRTLCGLLGLRRQSKEECRQLYVLLLELAARNTVCIEFESANSPRIIAVALPVQDTTGDTVGRLTEEVGRLRTQLGELQAEAERNSDTVNTAEELIALAETARGAAESALGAVQAELQEAQEAIKTLGASAERRIDALGQKVVRDAATIDELREEIRRLKQQLKELVAQSEQPRPKLKGITMTSSDTDRTVLGCGCVVERVDTTDCKIMVLEGDHPFIAVGVPNTHDPQTMADAITRAIIAVDN